MHAAFPNVTYLPRPERFERLLTAHYLDLSSGAWKYPTNQRVATCGRCGGVLPKATGVPYNEFLSDGYRATTKYLCGPCFTSASAGPALQERA